MAVEDGAQQVLPEVATHSAGGLLPGLWKFQLLLHFLNPRRGMQLIKQRLVGNLNVSCQVLPPTNLTGMLSLIFN